MDVRSPVKDFRPKSFSGGHEPDLAGINATRAPNGSMKFDRRTAHSREISALMPVKNVILAADAATSGQMARELGPGYRIYIFIICRSGAMKGTSSMTEDAMTFTANGPMPVPKIPGQNPGRLRTSVR